ncbi:MAG TPA: ATP synthase F1 subunit delta [Frankiaceae bacterium]|jgi:F-type H+-transporting ATPase subunit delta|nr:ATP synthase F1 subunit delta [Frankiaceae bacterium]
MSDDQIDGYATALFEVARSEDVLGRVGDELFRFSRAVEASPDLRSALTDPGAAEGAKRHILDDLLGGKVHPVTIRLLTLVIDAGLARDLSRLADAFNTKASQAGQASVAEVRVAAPLDDDQRWRLAEALSRAKGRPVDIKVIVDPSVMGGVVTTIGDEVIDGSVRRRLEQLRESLAG